MARYVDGWVIPVPKKNLKAYLKVAKVSATKFKKYGAIDYVECVADDVPKGKITSFPKSVKLKAGETIVFAYVTYKSKAHRDKVMSKLHQDEEMLNIWENFPGDGMRMFWGGFKTVVSK